MESPRAPSLREAVEAWALIAGQSFGSPAAQIAAIHKELVQERGWLGEERFLHALNACMLLPGSEAQQLLIYVGWLSHGYVGGLLAGWLFVLPGFVTLLGMSVIFALYAGVPAVHGALLGFEAAVLAVIFEALVRLSRRVLTRPSAVVLAIAAFIALFLFQVPFPLVIVAAGVIGGVASPWFPPPTPPIARPAIHRPVLDGLLDDGLLPHVAPRPARDLAVGAAILGIWLLPTAILWSALGPDATFTQLGRFFSTSALVTFGGGYGVLPYVGQQAVEVHHWLEPRELLAGLGLAETTPGPLSQVAQVVGFLATYRDPGPLPAIAAGALGAVLTTWATFWPSFLWVLAGGPYLDRVRRWGRVSSGVRAITAAMVGIVASLVVWSAARVWFGSLTVWQVSGIQVPVPELGSVHPLGIGVTVAAAVGMLRFRLQTTWVLMLGAVAGLVGWLIFG